MKASHVRPGQRTHDLDHIGPAFALFDLGDERLRASELPGQLDLREALGAAGVGQQASEAGVFAGERRPGGGIDVVLSDGVALRFGFDARILFDKPFAGDTTHQFRFTTGITFRSNFK